MLTPSELTLNNPTQDGLSIKLFSTKSKLKKKPKDSLKKPDLPKLPRRKELLKS